MYIARTNSTNTLLKELIAKGQWPMAERFIRAGYQTAGRGQTGNGWESEPDKNLLCSVLISRQLSAFSNQPFYLNVAISVAVHKAVMGYGLPVTGLTIKWPNDIYWNDQKIAGILIENAIIGNEVKYSIAGIGLNVNQTAFVSDAPNPVSLKQITGKDYDLDELMARLMEEIDEGLRDSGDGLWEYYKAHLYRREGFWSFVEREVNTAPTMNADSKEPIADRFMARIEEVLPTGEIVLQDQQGKERKYHFKQVRYVI